MLEMIHRVLYTGFKEVNILQACQIILSNRIRERMKEIDTSCCLLDKMTVASLATKVAVSEVYIRKIMNDTRSCSQEVQFAIANALLCTVDEVFFIKKLKL